MASSIIKSMIDSQVFHHGYDNLWTISHILWIRIHNVDVSSPMYGMGHTICLNTVSCKQMH